MVAVDFLPQGRQRFRDAGIRLCGSVTSRQVSRSIIGDHLIHVLARSIGKKILEQIVEMAADVSPQKLVADIGPRRARKNALYRAADIRSGV